MVEIATLRLPSQAITEGLQVGDGDEVVLEASSSVVQHLVQDLQQPQSQTVSATPRHSQISAVLDLQVLSDLAGIPPEEFLVDLQADLAATTTRSDPTTTTTAADRDSPHDTSSHPQQHQHPPTLERVDEETPLLTTCMETETIALPADPFLERLVDVLPTTMINDTDSRSLGHSTIMEETSSLLPPTTTNATSISASLDESSTMTHHVEATATKTQDDQHLAHDAFLLNIPTETDSGTLQDHFVLALPEIVLEPPSVASSQITTDSSHFPSSFVPLMEKAMSILPNGHLPSDVQAVHLEAHTLTTTTTTTTTTELVPTQAPPPLSHEQKDEEWTKDQISITQPRQVLQLDLVVTHKVPIIGHVILLSGLIALASVGAALDFQVGPSSTKKTMWRQMATSLVLLPLVIKSIHQQGLPRLTNRQWLELILSAMAYAYMCLAFVVALTMTSMANAFVLSNMTSLVLIAGRVALGLPIVALEGVGAVIGFAGAAICAKDTSAVMTPTTSPETTGVVVDATTMTSTAMWGNVMALSASFGTAFYLLVAKNLRSSMDLFVFIFCIMTLGSLFLLLYMMAVGEPYTWDTDPTYGVFGWLHPSMDRLPLELYMAIVCNCLGTTGYIAVMKYFDPIVPATVMLMEPVIGALLGVAAGTATYPGMQTWIGDAIVTLGTFCVIWSGSKKTETIDAGQALRPSSNDDEETVASFLLTSPLVRKATPAQRKASFDGQSEGPTKVVWDTT